MVDRRHQARAHQFGLGLGWHVATPQEEEHRRERHPADGRIQRGPADEHLLIRRGGNGGGPRRGMGRLARSRSLVGLRHLDPVA